MPSQFFGLNIAYTGLLASNAAMNTTSNNIANVQTEGYSRQQVTQQASNALRVFQTYGCAGAGVETLAIERIRDEFYDGRFWDNNAQLGEYDMKQYYMQQLETYFDDDGKSTGFKTIFDQLMITGMQALLKDPNSATAKSQFVGYAGALTEYFNGMAGNLENTGYAKEGHACLYNIGNMEETAPVLALGAGAVTKWLFARERRIERAPNLRNIEEYIARVAEMVERKRALIGGDEK